MSDERFTKPLPLSILSLLSQGLTQSQVAKKLGISKQLVHYHTSKLVESGLLIPEKLGKITVFHLTPEGKKALDSQILPTKYCSRRPTRRSPRVRRAPSPDELITKIQETLPRIHYLLLTYSSPYPIEHKELEKQIDNTKIRIVFGKKKNQVTAWISNDTPGLDYEAFSLAKEIVLSEIEREIGERPPERDIKVVNFHLNRDVEGLRIEGAKSVTLSGFSYVIKRVYQKTPSMVRIEEQASTDLETLTALLRGGTSTYQLTQMVFMLTQNMRELADAMKFMNREQMELRKLIAELLKRIVDERTR
ncbi:MAG: hypothetical protein DRN78_05695 [Thermoproteota archaeon]|nr:MAG: hypothetical protein DRN78_05695 [Candidatus Korarchaeota archaeon]